MPGFNLLTDAPAMRPAGGSAPPAVRIDTIVIEGDSITSNTPSTPNGFYSYQYDASRPDKTIEVRAQGSRVVGTAAELNDNDNTLIGNVSEDLAYNPDLITYMIGANDMTLNSAASYRSNLIALYNAYKAAKPGIKIAWSPPIAYNPTGTAHPNKPNFDTQRADVLSTCRDPAVWSQWCDYYVPMGEIPDFGDVALAAPLFGDSVHPSTAGQSLLYESYRRVLDTILDPARASSTAPYSTVWPVDEGSLAANTMVTRRFILSGLAPASNHDLSVTGAEIRRNGGAWGTSLPDCYNGDIIDVRKTTSATGNQPVLYGLTIGSETRTITLTTVAAVDPVSYSHSGTAVEPNPVTNKTFAAQPFGTGLALLAIASTNGTPTSVTVGGTAATHIRRQTRAGGTGFDIYTCPVTAGNLDVVVSRATTSVRQVLSHVTLLNADPVPVAQDGSAPLNQSAPHQTASLTVPANGMAFGWLMEEAGAAITPATANAPSVLIHEANTMYQSSWAGLALARRDTTGALSWNWNFGSFARAGVVFKAAGT